MVQGIITTQAELQEEVNKGHGVRLSRVRNSFIYHHLIEDSQPQGSHYYARSGISHQAYFSLLD